MDNDKEHTLVLDISDFALSKTISSDATENLDNFFSEAPELPQELSVKLDEEGEQVPESTIDLQDGIPVLSMGSLSLPAGVKKNTPQTQRSKATTDHKAPDVGETLNKEKTLDESRAMSDKEEILEMDAENVDDAVQSADEIQDEEMQEVAETSQDEIEDTEDDIDPNDLDDEFDEDAEDGESHEDKSDDEEDESDEEEEDEETSAADVDSDDEPIEAVASEERQEKDVTSSEVKKAISESSGDVDPDFAEKITDDVQADTVAPQAEAVTEVAAKDIQQETIDYQQPEVSPIRQSQPLPEASRQHSLVPVGEMPVTLTFETGRNKITVGELEKIKEGYTFECGNPTEAPVTICANDLPIGIGELVDIEGRIGVRVIKFDNK